MGGELFLGGGKGMMFLWVGFGKEEARIGGE